MGGSLGLQPFSHLFLALSAVRDGGGMVFVGTGAAMDASRV